MAIRWRTMTTRDRRRTDGSQPFRRGQAVSARPYSPRRTPHPHRRHAARSPGPRSTAASHRPHTSARYPTLRQPLRGSTTAGAPRQSARGARRPPLSRARPERRGPTPQMAIVSRSGERPPPSQRVWLRRRRTNRRGRSATRSKCRGRRCQPRTSRPTCAASDLPERQLHHLKMVRTAVPGSLPVTTAPMVVAA